MTHHRRGALRTALVLGAILTACTDAPVTPRASPPQPPDAALSLLARGGLRVQEQRMNALLRQVTREVAFALANDRLRAQVYTELHASPYREHKLHFGTFLRGSAKPLLAAMAAARSAAPDAGVSGGAALTSDAVLATLDSIVDLEFYMPVKEHFVTWTGGRDLIVASALRDDGRVPFGFDLTGQPVALSAAEPPPTPTLVLVPVETDFSRIPAPPPANVNAAMSTIPGVYMTREVVYDDHEGWPNGAPEFEVHLFQTDVDMEYIDVICAGEAQTPPYQYNTEETQDWSGEVLLATEGRLALSPNNQFQVWEDDTGACTATGGRPPDTQSATVSQYANWASAVLNVATSNNTVSLIKAIVNFIPATYTFAGAFFEDDEVGTLTLATGCWPSSPGPVMFSIISSESGHPTTGWVLLDYRFGGARDPICPPPPPPPPPSVSVTISGPSPVPAYASCPYIGGASGGADPYSYSWSVDGAPAGDGSNLIYYSNSGTSFTVTLTVTDANGLSGSTAMSVSVDPNLTSCDMQ